MIGVVRFLARCRRGALRAWGIGAGVLLVLLGLTPGQGSQAQAAGGLLVAPTRLVFEGRTRSAQITLVNKGTKRAVYRITMVNRRMLEDGSFEPVEEALPGELFSANFIRHAPRRVALEPNQPQTIRILVRKPRDLPAGEYRSHMMFQTIPDASSEQSAEESYAPAVGLTIRLRAVFGVTIPIIVRHGEVTADITITSAEFEPAKEGSIRPALTVRLARSGNRSIYGDITVKLLGEDGGEQQIGKIRGIAVYSPNRIRTVRIPIDPNFAPQLKGSQIRVSFLTPANSGGSTLAENQFTVR